MNTVEHPVYGHMYINKPTGTIVKIASGFGFDGTPWNVVSRRVSRDKRFAKKAARTDESMFLVDHGTAYGVDFDAFISPSSN